MHTVHIQAAGGRHGSLHSRFRNLVKDGTGSGSRIEPEEHCNTVGDGLALPIIVGGQIDGCGSFGGILDLANGLGLLLEKGEARLKVARQSHSLQILL